MDQKNNAGFGTPGSSTSDRTGSTPTSGDFNTGSSGANISTGSDLGTCEHCGQTLSKDSGIEQFLGKIGISSEMIENLRSQFENVDVEQYLTTARDYLKGAGDKLKTSGDKAKTFTKENPGKVAAGVAALAVGAGLLLNALNNKDR